MLSDLRNSRDVVGAESHCGVAAAAPTRLSSTRQVSWRRAQLSWRKRPGRPERLSLVGLVPSFADASAFRVRGAARRIWEAGWRVKIPLTLDSLNRSSAMISGSRRISVGAFVLLASIWAACKDDTEATQPLKAAPPSRSLVGKPTSVRKAEAAFFAIAASSPSSAGFYIDSAGTLVVQVRDSIDFGAARGAIGSLFSNAAINAPS